MLDVNTEVHGVGVNAKFIRFFGFWGLWLRLRFFLFFGPFARLLRLLVIALMAAAHRRIGKRISHGLHGHGHLHRNRHRHDTLHLDNLHRLFPVLDFLLK